MLPNPESIKIENPNEFNYSKFPAKGLTGDPSVPPRKQYVLMKQQPLPVEPPKFLRSSISVDDIKGTKSRSLYRGVAK